MIEAGRRRQAATTLQGQLDAIGYGLPAIEEARRRAWAIIDRKLPKLPQAHGFYDPDGFVAGSIRSGNRFGMFKEIEPRLLAKIVKRDGLLPDADERERAA
jgi:hypothetical protein